MEREPAKTLSRLFLLISLAGLLNGFLAGENIFRYAFEVPGWKHINISEWGEYSRHADLGNGIFLFPIEAIGSTLLLIFASTMVLKRKSEFAKVSPAIFTSTILALAGLVFTFFAAPYMLSVRTIGNDPELLNQTFNHFHHWGFIRSIAQVLSFCAIIWSMNKLFHLKSYT